MNDLRAKQIREILDYDKNIDRQVYDLEKKHVSLQDEAVQPFVSVDQNIITSTKDSVTSFLILLEKKKADLNSIIQGTIPQTNFANIDNYINEITLVEDVIKKYNIISQPFIDPSITQQTKNLILSTAMKLEAPIKDFNNEIYQMLSVLGSRRLGKGSENLRMNRYFVKLFNACAVYNVISNQLKDARLSPISNNDVYIEKERLIERQGGNGRNWRAIIKTIGDKTYDISKVAQFEKVGVHGEEEPQEADEEEIEPLISLKMDEQGIMFQVFRIIFDKFSEYIEKIAPKLEAILGENNPKQRKTNIKKAEYNKAMIDFEKTIIKTSKENKIVVSGEHIETLKIIKKHYLDLKVYLTMKNVADADLQLKINDLYDILRQLEEELHEITAANSVQELEPPTGQSEGEATDPEGAEEEKK